MRRPNLPRSPAARGCLAAVGALLLLVLLLVLLREPLLRGFGGWFEVGEEPVAADFVYLLNGDSRTVERAERAAALHAAGYAPRVVIPRSVDWPSYTRGLYPNETEVSLGVLRQEGVPNTALELMVWRDGVTSTRDEALALREYLALRPADRVLVVTTAYHTRRARSLLRRELRGTPTEIRMIAAPHPAFSGRDWWRSETGMLAVFSEMVKMVQNRL
jgi:uncharacterized SAM-binding protein YcdF (DUF218 family)